LSAKFHEENKEDNVVNIKSRSTKKLIIAVAAAVVILSLTTIVGFAYSSQIVQLLSGGRLESGQTEDGRYFTSLTVSEADPDPVEVRDGQVYFTVDGSNKNITAYCTETTYFHYEKIADNGYRHVFVVGGAPDNLGWAEFIWDEDGNHIAFARMLPSVNDFDNMPVWMELADEAFEIMIR
jgi:hypothetical protein